MAEPTEPPRKPRLALCGSAGVGKTTLARALAARWQVPYVEEGMRRRLEGGFDPHGLSRAGHRALLLELAEEAHAAVAAAIAGQGGVVADRSPIDSLAFWLHFGFAHEPEERTAALVATLLERCRQFDLVLLLPWGVLPLQDDGIRSANRWLQLKFHALVEGLARELLPAAQLALLPKERVAPQDRIAWVEAKLNVLPESISI